MNPSLLVSFRASILISILIACNDTDDSVNPNKGRLQPRGHEMMASGEKGVVVYRHPCIDQQRAILTKRGILTHQPPHTPLPSPPLQSMLVGSNVHNSSDYQLKRDHAMFVFSPGDGPPSGRYDTTARHACDPLSGHSQTHWRTCSTLVPLGVPADRCGFGWQ